MVLKVRECGRVKREIRQVWGWIKIIFLNPKHSAEYWELFISELLNNSNISFFITSIQ